MSGRHLRLVPPAPPSSRGDCVNGVRPCPYKSCRHHLTYGELRPLPAHVTESCTLDLADRGGMSAEEIGDLFGVTRQRINQDEMRALARLSEPARAALVEECRDGWTHATDYVHPDSTVYGDGYAKHPPSKLRLIARETFPKSQLHAEMDREVVG